MKRNISLLFLFLVASSSLFAITSGTTSDGITWVLNTETGELIIKGDYVSIETEKPWSSYRNSIISVVIQYGITGIGNRAFEDYKKLTSVTIPKSVWSMGDYAFSSCSSLVSITIPKGVTSIGSSAFYGCEGLTSITLSENLTSIGSSAFANCNKLTSITIPKGVTSIGEVAFSGCSSLASINIPEGVTRIEDDTFTGCSSLTSINIPESVVSIGSSAFYGCEGLTSITLPENLTSIGQYAFSGCNGLTSITIPKGVTSIGKYAFSGCSRLASITLPDGLTSIGQNAFFGCNGLTSITIPESVTNIGEGAFSSCNSLSSLSVAQRNPKYDSRGNCNAIIETASNTLICGCYATIIPESVTSIGEKAFYACSNLSSIAIPEDVECIEDYAFYYCEGLTSITIPESVTSIGNYAFSRCDNLSVLSVAQRNSRYDSRDNCNAIIETTSRTLVVGCKNTTIPEGVTDIGERAFYACESLDFITFPESLTSIRDEAFKGCGSLTTVTIPEGVTDIGEKAFYACSSLSSIAIPSSITTIGSGAFDSCPLSKVVNLSKCNVSVSATCMVFNKEDIFRLIGLAENSFTYSNFSPMPTFSEDTVPFRVSFLGTSCLKRDVGIYTENCKFHFSDGDLEFNAILPYTYTITPAPVTINVASTSREYGDANPEFDYTVSGLFGNDAIDVTLTAPDCRSNAGNYSFTASTTSQNYSIANTTGTLTITKAPLMVIVDSYSKVYGDTKPKYTARYQGFKNGENTSVLSSMPTISCQATVSSPVGEYAITATGGEAQNYEFTEYVPGTLIVTKAPLTIAANNVSRLYFEDTPEYTFSSKGWKNGEDASVLTAQPTMQCAAEKTSPAGVYDIILSGAEAQNYNISYQNGSLTIGKRTLTVTAKDAERYYGDENPKFECTFNGFVNDETAAVLTTMPEAVTTAEQWSDVGTYSIVMQGGEATNYKFSYVNGQLSVLRAPQKIEWEQELGTVAVGSQVLLTAKATSGLEIEFKYDAELAEIYPTFDGLVLDCLKEGVLTIRATQDGNQNYHPAERVVKTINIVSTGIASVIQEGEDAIYDLQGRKVLEAVKGFYIQNGKKVYRK